MQLMTIDTPESMVPAPIYTYSLDRILGMPALLDELVGCPRGVSIDAHLTEDQQSGSVRLNFQIRHGYGAGASEVVEIERSWQAVRPAVLEHVQYLSENWLPSMHVLLWRDLAKSKINTSLTEDQVRRVAQESLATRLVELAFRRLENGMRGGDAEVRGN
jgi:hypothetical protein